MPPLERAKRRMESADKFEQRARKVRAFEPEIIDQDWRRADNTDTVPR
jgi:hypothetical protein